MKKLLIVMFVLILTVLVINAEELPQGQIQATNGDIIVNGKLIDAPKPSVTEGVIMLPLIPICEALGMIVNWDGETMSASIDFNIYIWIGKALYTEKGNDPVEFGPAPQLIDNYVYVPIYFFGHALKGFDAGISEGRIVVNATDNGSGK